MSAAAVIFDMDGVLVDSYRAHFDSWKATAATFGLSMQERDFARTFGRTSRDIIQHLWPNRFDLNWVRGFDEKKEAAYRAIIARDFPEMQGASDLIERLHVDGFAMAIGSSGPSENVAVVKQCLRTGRHITATVSGSDVTHGKPDPEIFLTAAKKLGIGPSRCVVIEDAPAGVEAGIRAGMKVIALLGTAEESVLKEKGAQRVVARLDEIKPADVLALLA